MGTETLKAAQDFGRAVPQALLPVAGMIGGIDAALLRGFQAAVTTSPCTIADRVGLANYLAHDTGLSVASSSASDDALAAATTVLTATGNPTDGKIVTIDARVFTFKDTLSTGPDVPDEVKIGAAATDTLDNLAAAMEGSAGSGTKYGVGTLPHATVSAAAGTGDTLDMAARTAGAAGNAIVTTTDSSDLAFTGSTLAGGASSITVTIEGIDVDGNAFSEDLVLNGTTLVSVTSEIAKVTSMTLSAAAVGTVKLFGGTATAGVPDTATRVYASIAPASTSDVSSDFALQSVLNASSSSTADAAAGTGARTIRVHGLDPNYELASYDVTLNGRTAVALGGKLLRIHSVEVLTAGSGGVNAGVIYLSTGALTNGVPDTDAEIYAEVIAGENMSHMAQYTVPDGKKGYITRIDVHSIAATNSTAKASLATRAPNEVFRTIEKRYVNVSSAPGVVDYSAAAMEIPARTDVEVRATAVANTADVAVSVVMLLVDDE